MTNGKCSQCNSANVYMTEDSFEGGALLFRESGDRITFNCYVCVDCRYTAFYAKERTVSIFGKSKSLNELVVADTKKWKRAA